jgi:hypothetical protein
MIFTLNLRNARKSVEKEIVSTKTAIMDQNALEELVPLSIV